MHLSCAYCLRTRSANASNQILSPALCKGFAETRICHGQPPGQSPFDLGENTGGPQPGYIQLLLVLYNWRPADHDEQVRQPARTDRPHAQLAFHDFTLQNAHAGSRTRVTSMGGLYDAATLHAL